LKEKKDLKQVFIKKEAPKVQNKIEVQPEKNPQKNHDYLFKKIIDQPKTRFTPKKLH